MSAYDELAELAQRELELVTAGELEPLTELRARRSALVATLPATPPGAARPALERALAFQARVTAALEDRVREAGSELRKLTHGRSAVRGYAPHVDRLKLVDRAG
jgi:hypothetical protein